MYEIRYIKDSTNIPFYKDTIAGGDSVRLTSPELDLKDNAAGTLTFTMPVTNVIYDMIEPTTPTIEVYRDNTWIWSGRPLSISKDFWLNKKVTCEGALSFLNDTVQPLHNYKNTPIDSFVDWLLYHHNNRSGLPDSRKIYIGAVDKTTISGKSITDVNVVTDNDTTLSYLSNLVDEWGLHMYVKKVNGVLKLYLINGRNLNKATQDIDFGKNLLDYSDNYNWSDIVTVLHPIGKKLDTTTKTGDEDYPDYVTLDYVPPENSSSSGSSSSGTSSGEGGISGTIGGGTSGGISGTIGGNDSDGEGIIGAGEDDSEGESGSGSDEGLSGSGDSGITGTIGTNIFSNTSSTPKQGFTQEGEFLKLDSAVNLYGRIEQTVTWSEVDDPVTLLRLAEAYLEDYQYTEMELTVKVIDLYYISTTENPYTAYNFLDKVDCKSEPHNLKTNFVITEMKIPFDNPENMTLSLKRNTTVGYGANGDSVRSGIISAAGSQVVSKNNLLKLAKENAAALMDMNSNGFVSFIPPVEVTDNASLTPNKIPTTDINRNDRIAEVWITDDIDPNEATNRWRWNINGLCHQSRDSISSNWDPPNVAITMDGAIVADFITTGRLLVPDALGGTLFSADIDSNEVHMAGFTVTNHSLYDGKSTLGSDAYGVYVGTDGFATGSGSMFVAISQGYMYGGEGGRNGYVGFNTYNTQTQEYGTRVLGRGCVAIGTNGFFGVGNYCEINQGMEVAKGVTRSVTVGNQVLEFVHGLLNSEGGISDAGGDNSGESGSSGTIGGDDGGYSGTLGG